jgi:hypothetical protein
MHCQSNLLEVVGALHPTRGLASRLDSRQQQRDEDADDRNYDKKFYEREASL